MQVAERCPWCGDDPLYVRYHDEEWGVPQRDGRALWELLMLEAFQSGLSWITILRKREGFRRAFAGFDPETLAGWGEAEVARLVLDPGIVRHRGKIGAVLGAARAYLQIEAREGFAQFVWKHQEGRVRQNRFKTLDDVPAQSATSERLARALRQEGFRFCGPTTVYAFMQASGMVNDHLTGCPAHAACAALAGF
jgi:DNA-3-methyladenine glycosylase I